MLVIWSLVPLPFHFLKKSITSFKLDHNFTTLCWFLPYTELAWISQDAHVPTYPELPIHFPPHPIPVGCPRATALSALLHALNLHWSSILHMVIYIFQYYSLKSSHPPLLLHSPKVCSLYLCLFCCLAYRIIITIFLNSIYVH